jgi:hypothetical protein
MEPPTRRIAPSPAAATAAQNYAELLAKLEVRRRASDVLLLRTMMHVREATTPAPPIPDHAAHRRRAGAG